jgi:hypothetical protein
MTTRPVTTQLRSLWRRTFASVLIIGLAALALAPVAAAGPPSKMDRYLRDHAGQSADETPFKVIVTTRPGAKRGLIQALKAQGVNVNADFTLIEAFAATLPAGLLRALAQNPAVEAISTDAPVTASGVTTSVSGSPLNSPYTLRGTLGLDTTTLATGTIGASTLSAAKGTKKSSLSWAHTVDAGANRLLVVSTAHRDGSKYVSRVTYGGVALSIRMSAGASNNSAGLWYLLNPPWGPLPSW